MSKVSRRRFLQISALSAAFLAACQPSPAPAPTKAPEAEPAEEVEPAPVTEAASIKMMWRTNPNENPMIDKIVDLWNEKHPNIKLEAVYVPWDEFEPKLMTEYAAGIAPDIYGTGGTNPYVERYYRGMVLKLDPYLDLEPELKDDLWEVGVDSYTIDGNLVALPIGICQAAVSINATRFDEAGLPYPPHNWDTTAWTWEEMIETAKQLTLDKDDDGRLDQYGVNLGHSSPWTYTRLWGQDIVSDEDYASGICRKWQTDKPEVYEALVEGLQARADAIYEHGVTPSPETSSSLSQMGPMLKTGVIAMEFTGGWALWGELPEEFDFRYAINPLGGVNGGGTRVENCWAEPLQASSQTQFADASWQFLRFMSFDPDAQLIQIQGRSVIPAAKSALDAYVAEYQDRIAMTADEQRTFLLGALEQAKTTVPCHILLGWAAVRDIWGAEMSSVWLGEISAKEAVDSFAPKVNQRLAEYLEELELT